MGFARMCIMHSRTAKNVLREIATETLFYYCSLYVLPNRVVRKIHDILDLTTGRSIFSSVSEESNALIFGVKQPKKTVSSLSD